MSTQIFVNLPVKYLQQSIEFFTKLGFQFNPQFTDETATCMIVSETIFVMLLTHEKFKTFTPKPICDATNDIAQINKSILVFKQETLLKPLLLMAKK